MIIELLFKDPVVESEFFDPSITDPRLFGMVCAFGNWTWRRFKKHAVVTGVARYTGREDSPHKITAKNPLARAADIRAHHGYWTEDELATLKDWLRNNFPRHDMIKCEIQIPGWYGTLRHHGEGDEEHLHLAVVTIEQLRASLGVPIA